MSAVRGFQFVGTDNGADLVQASVYLDAAAKAIGFAYTDRLGAVRVD